MRGLLKDEHQRKLQVSEAGGRCSPKKATDNKGWDAVDLSTSPALWIAPHWGPLLLSQGLNPHSKTLDQTTNSLRNINQAGQNSML